MSAASNIFIVIGSGILVVLVNLILSNLVDKTYNKSRIHTWVAFLIMMVFSFFVGTFASNFL
jgi:hypothetical protein